MVRSQPLKVHQGDKFQQVVIVTDKGQPADLTGYTATAQIRLDVADVAPTVEADIACEVGFDQYGGPDDPTLGIILLTMAPTVTVDLVGRYVWDLQLVNGSNEPTTILRGPVYVSLEVTR